METKDNTKDEYPMSNYEGKNRRTLSPNAPMKNSVEPRIEKSGRKYGRCKTADNRENILRCSLKEESDKEQETCIRK